MVTLSTQPSLVPGFGNDPNVGCDGNTWAAGNSNMVDSCCCSGYTYSYWYYYPPQGATCTLNGDTGNQYSIWEAYFPTAVTVQYFIIVMNENDAWTNQFQNTIFYYYNAASCGGWCSQSNFISTSANTGWIQVNNPYSSNNYRLQTNNGQSTHFYEVAMFSNYYLEYNTAIYSVGFTTGTSTQPNVASNNYYRPYQMSTWLQSNYASYAVASNQINNPAFTITLKSAHQIKAVVLLNRNDMLISNSIYDPSNVSVNVISVTGTTIPCSTQVLSSPGNNNYGSQYAEAQCDNSVGYQVVLYKTGNAILSFANVGIISDCDCSLSSVNPANFSPYPQISPFPTTTFSLLSGTPSSGGLQYISYTSATGTYTFKTLYINNFNYQIKVTLGQKDNVSSVCGNADGTSWCSGKGFIQQAIVSTFSTGSYVSLNTVVVNPSTLTSSGSINIDVNSVQYINQSPLTQTYPLQGTQSFTVTNSFTVTSSSNFAQPVTITIQQYYSNCISQVLSLLSGAQVSQSSYLSSSTSTNPNSGCDDIVIQGSSYSTLVHTNQDTPNIPANYWIAQFTSSKSVQTVLLLFADNCQAPCSDALSYIMSVGNSINTSAHTVCNSSITGGGWWQCGTAINGQYLAVYSLTSYLNFYEVAAYSQYAIQTNSYSQAFYSYNANGGGTLLLTVSGSISNIVNFYLPSSSDTCLSYTQTTYCSSYYGCRPSYVLQLNAQILIDGTIILPSDAGNGASYVTNQNQAAGINLKSITRNNGSPDSYSNSYPQCSGSSYSYNYGYGGYGYYLPNLYTVQEAQCNGANGYSGIQVILSVNSYSSINFCSIGILSKCVCSGSSFDQNFMSPSLYTPFATFTIPASLTTILSPYYSAASPQPTASASPFINTNSAPSFYSYLYSPAMATQTIQLNLLVPDTVSVVCGNADSTTWCSSTPQSTVTSPRTISFTNYVSTQVPPTSFMGTLNTAQPQGTQIGPLLYKLTSSLTWKPSTNQLFFQTVSCSEAPGSYTLTVTICLPAPNVGICQSQPLTFNVMPATSDYYCLNTLPINSLNLFNTNVQVKQQSSICTAGYADLPSYGCDGVVLSQQSLSNIVKISSPFVPPTTNVNTGPQFWMAIFPQQTLFQTVLIINIDNNTPDFYYLGYSYLKVGNDTSNAANPVCNHNLQLGGWYSCGLTGSILSIEIAQQNPIDFYNIEFVEIMAFTQYAIQVNAVLAQFQANNQFATSVYSYKVVLDKQRTDHTCNSPLIVQDPNTFTITFKSQVYINGVMLLPAQNGAILLDYQLYSVFINNVTSSQVQCQNVVLNPLANSVTQIQDPQLNGQLSNSWSVQNTQTEFLCLAAGYQVIIKSPGPRTLEFCGIGVMADCNCATSSFDPLLMPNTNQAITQITLYLNATINMTNQLFLNLNDTVSLACGNADGSTFCGGRWVEFYFLDTQQKLKSWPYHGLSWDDTRQTLTLAPKNNSTDPGKFTLQAVVSLQNWSVLRILTLYIEVFNNPSECSFTQLQTVNNGETTIRIYRTYYLDQPLNLAVPNVTDNYTQSIFNGVNPQCGPYFYKIIQTGLESLVFFNSFNQSITFLQNKFGPLYGNFQFSVTAGLLNWPYLAPVVFNYTYTLNPCIVQSLTPVQDNFILKVDNKGGKTGMQIPDFIQSPFCGYNIESYQVLALLDHFANMISHLPTTQNNTLEIYLDTTSLQGINTTQHYFFSVKPVYPISQQFGLTTAALLNKITIEVIFYVPEPQQESDSTEPEEAKRIVITPASKAMWVVNSTMVATIALGVVSGTGVQYMNQMVSFMQFVIHTAMLNITMPEQSLQLIKESKNIAYFDFLNAGNKAKDVYGNLTTNTYDSNSTNHSYESSQGRRLSFGTEVYQSVNIFDNLGTSIFVAIFAMLTKLFHITIYLVNKSTKMQIKLLVTIQKYMAKYITPGVYIRLIFLCQFQLLFASIIAVMSSASAQTFLDYFSVWLGWVIIVVLIKLQLLAFLKVWWLKKRNRLIYPLDFKTWGEIYKAYLHEILPSSWQLQYETIMSIRRVCTIIGIIVAPKIVSFQIGNLLWMCIFWAGYSTEYQPMIDRHRNYLDQFNNVCYYFMVLLCFQFTPFCDDQDVKNTLGDMFNGIYYFMIAVNTLYMIGVTTRSVLRILRGRYTAIARQKEAAEKNQVIIIANLKKELDIKLGNIQNQHVEMTWSQLKINSKWKGERQSMQELNIEEEEKKEPKEERKEQRYKNVSFGGIDLEEQKHQKPVEQHLLEQNLQIKKPLVFEEMLRQYQTFYDEFQQKKQKSLLIDVNGQVDDLRGQHQINLDKMKRNKESRNGIFEEANQVRTVDKDDLERSTILENQISILELKDQLGNKNYIPVKEKKHINVIVNGRSSRIYIGDHGMYDQRNMQKGTGVQEDIRRLQPMQENRKPKLTPEESKLLIDESQSLKKVWR